MISPPPPGTQGCASRTGGDEFRPIECFIPLVDALCSFRFSLGAHMCPPPPPPPCEGDSDPGRARVSPRADGVWRVTSPDGGQRAPSVSSKIGVVE